MQLKELLDAQKLWNMISRRLCWRNAFGRARRMPNKKSSPQKMRPIKHAKNRMSSTGVCWSWQSNSREIFWPVWCRSWVKCCDGVSCYTSQKVYCDWRCAWYECWIIRSTVIIHSMNLRIKLSSEHLPCTKCMWWSTMQINESCKICPFFRS